MRTLPATRAAITIATGLFIIVGCWLRLYHLPQTLLFLGDQGRDALIAKAILKDHDIALIGPVTSVGNMYLGPFYYYFMVPFLALTYPNPIGPAIGVAIINCLSLFLLAHIGRKYFSPTAGLVATGMYACMPLAVTFSRFSWNPNLGAPVGLALFWALLRWKETLSWKQAALIGSLFGILIQLHYVTLTTAGVLGVVWIWSYVQHYSQRRMLWGQLMLVISIVALLLSPLFIFNYRHNNMLFTQFFSFFTSGEQHIQPPGHWLTVVKETEGRMYRILSQTISGQKHVEVDRLLSIFGVVLMSWLIWKSRIVSKFSPAIVILVVWLFFAILGTSFYSSSILDHYLTYCFPLIALFWAVLISSLWQYKWGVGVAGGLLIYFAVLLFSGIQHMSFSGKGTEIYEAVAKVITPAVVQPYNIALLGANGDFQGMNYRYFLDVSSKRPQGNEIYTNLSTLAVIDEMGNNSPLSVGAYEIQAPQLASLAATLWVPNGPRVFIFK